MNESEQQNQFEILADGVLVSVKFKAVNGALPNDETVKIRKLGRAEMPLLASAMGDENKEVALVTGKDRAWVEALEDDSFETLIEEGRRLNFTRFGKYWKRQSELLRALGQGSAMEKAVEKALDLALAESRPSAKFSNS